MPRIWDPAAGPPSSAQMIAVDTMLFCAGHALLPDGRLLVSGGHLQDDRGIATTFFFDQNGGAQRGEDIQNARWYPTVTVLADGRVLTMAGRNEASDVVRIRRFSRAAIGSSCRERTAARTTRSPTTRGTSSRRTEGSSTPASASALGGSMWTERAPAAIAAVGSTGRTTSGPSTGTTAPRRCTSRARSFTPAGAATQAGLLRTPSRTRPPRRRSSSI